MAENLTHVESATTWRKSSYSGGEGNCVEIAPAPDTTAVRDSKAPSGPTLHFDSRAWAEFLDGLRGTTP